MVSHPICKCCFPISNNIWHSNTSSFDEAATLTLSNANLLKVEQTGAANASCHNGYKSCFYRKLADDVNPADASSFKLQFTSQPLFDPATVYKKK
jgi:hypothetical protein